jgi:hypothetical protein
LPGSDPARGRGPWPVRVGLIVVVGVYLASVLFGIAAPLLWGHHGYHAATYMLRAIMTLRFHIVTPSNWAGYEYPPRFAWYFHHPIGYHHLLVPFVWLFGAREWVARGFAATGGLFVLWALYALVKRHWSREMGLLATAVFVAMPFVTQYAVLLDPMLPTMALTLVALDSFLRYWEEPERRWLAAGCGAFVGAGLLMWDGYFEAFFLGVVAMCWLVTPRGLGARLLVDGKRTRLNAAIAWVGLTGAASALTMAFHFLFTWKVGMMSDFDASYHQRHAAGFDYVYGRELDWAGLLFGKPLLVAGILWVVVFVGRAAAGRARRRDVGVWLFLVNKTFYIYLFREAAAVHEYRVDWYSLFLALAVVDLISDAGALASTVIRRPRVAAIAAPAVMALLAAGFLHQEVPLGYKKLIESRETMGTDTPGYNADYPKQLFAQEVARRTGPEDFVFTLTAGFPRRIEFYFYMDRSNVDIASLNQLRTMRKERPRSLLVLNPSAVSGAERDILLELLRKYPADIYDGYMVVDMRHEQPGIHEYRFVPEPMGLLYRYFVSHKYPPMHPVPATSSTLECLYADARLPVPGDLAPLAPLGLPTAEQALCRHDLLLRKGDRAGADAVVEKLRGMLTPVDRALGPGLRIVAARFESRRGDDVWLRVDAPKLVPDAIALRLRLRAADAGANPKTPIVVEQRVTKRLREAPEGTLDFERFPPMYMPVGRFHAQIELVDYSRPAPAAAPRPPVEETPARRRRPHRRRGHAPPPPTSTIVPAPARAKGPPALLPAAASADLGIVEIR